MKRESIRPEGAPRLGETYASWRDFTNRVARPLLEAEEADDAKATAWYYALMQEPSSYYLAVSLVMADNRIRELEARECASCYHGVSMHEPDFTECMAMGCQCEGWEDDND